MRLLLAIAPDMFANEIFAMKGGTAINLFVRNMPRLSVDIDVVYMPWQHPRDQAVPVIAAELSDRRTRGQARPECQDGGEQGSWRYPAPD